MCVDVIDTVRVFLPKCPLTTVRSRFSVVELQIVRGEALYLLTYTLPYLPMTYTTITGNSFDRKKPNQQIR